MIVQDYLFFGMMMSANLTKNNLLTTINLKKNCYEAGSLIENNEHTLTISISEQCDYANLVFSTKESLYDFALSLLYMSVYGKKLQRRYRVLKDNNGCLMVKYGTRLSADSCDLIISVIDSINQNNLPTELSLTVYKERYQSLGDEIGALTWEDEKHQLKVSINEKENYALFLFTTREMLYDFAVALLSDAVNDGCTRECLPFQDFDGSIPSIGGIRMSLDSARLFIFVEDDDKA